jgi:trimethylamine--corrinoid protein Co-methyltransferase
LRKASAAKVKLFTEADLDQLTAAVYRLLTEVGLKVEHEEVAARLKAAGGLESPNGRLRIPLELIEELVAAQQRRAPQDLARDRLRPTGPRTEGVMDVAYLPGPTNYYDYTSGQVQPIDTRLFTLLLQFADATPEIAGIQPCFRQDAPAETEPVESVVLGLKLTRKLVGVDALLPAHVKYLAEISEIVTGQAGNFYYLTGSQCMTSPLILGHRSAEEMLERARCHVPEYFVPTMTMLGFSTPVTLAGGIVLGAAEVLGGMVAAYVINPEATIIGGAFTTTMDMADASCSMCSPEIALFDAGICELFERRWGGHLFEGIQYSPCSPVPGLGAVYENFLAAMGRAQWRGTPITDYTGRGLLANGRYASPVQAMLDIEVMKSLTYLNAPVTVSEATLPLEEIIDHVVRERDFLTSDHTLAHFREIWSSTVFRHNLADLPASTESAILDRCDQAWQANLARYQPPDWPEDTLRALDGVVAQARLELIG